MERLGQLLANSALGHEDQETIRAAAITSAAARIIQQELQLTALEARAVAYRRGEIIVRVSHGAVGGQIRIHQARLIEAINQAVLKLYPGPKPLVEHLIIRTQ